MERDAALLLPRRLRTAVRRRWILRARWRAAIRLFPVRLTLVRLNAVGIGASSPGFSTFTVP